MKKALLLALLITGRLAAQYADPNFPIPTSGYGSDGTHTVDVIAFNNPNFTGHNIEIYHPQDITTPVPTLFYSHAYGGNDSANISGVLHFIAQKGYAVVFVPYQTTNVVTVAQRYANLIAGFRKAAQDYPVIIDTSRVGFLGHSFGGAASFGIAHECFTADGWGANGRFIYALAQWYAYNLSPDDLTSFPTDTKVLVEVFNDDVTNDHRMAIDIFNHINIAAAEKDFLRVPSSTVNGYNYQAIHNLPNTSAAFDALDYYAYYRLLDALCDYTFTGSTAGKDVALGNGSTAQTTMPAGMGSLQEFENPMVEYSQGQYEFPCTSDENPRQEYCPEILRLDQMAYTGKALLLYPNPADTALYLQAQQQTQLQITLFNSLGQQIGSYTSATNNYTIDVSNLQRGVYFITVNGEQEKFIKI